MRFREFLLEEDGLGTIGSLAHQSVVDVNAGELLSNRLNKKCRDDRRINATGKCEQNLLVTNLCAYLLDLFFYKRIRKRFRCNTLHV